MSVGNFGCQQQFCLLFISPGQVFETPLLTSWKKHLRKVSSLLGHDATIFARLDLGLF